MKPSARLLIAGLLVIVCFILPAGPHHAFGKIDPPPPTHSLDNMVAGSDLVVRGTVTSTGLNAGLRTVGINVLETFKGKAKSEVIVEGSIARLESREGLNSGEWLLFLRLDAGDFPDRFPLYLYPDHAVDLSHDWMARMDFNVVSGREQILQAVRDAVALLPMDKRPDSMWLSISPTSPLYKKGLRGRDMLTVPVVGRLEELARQWVHSGERDIRWNAIRILDRFRSPENLQLLKGLLDDPDNYVEDVQRKALPAPLDFVTFDEGGTRHYPIRKQAYDVLRGWNVDVPPPVVEEPLGVSGWLVSLPYALGAVVVLVPLATIGMVLRRRRAAGLRPAVPPAKPGGSLQVGASP
jgi:hypothetical protein